MGGKASRCSQEQLPLRLLTVVRSRPEPELNGQALSGEPDPEERERIRDRIVDRFRRSPLNSQT